MSSGSTNSGTIKVKSEMDLLRKDRLPSLKSRDLTLGGLALKSNTATSNKREFKPNLNVQRNKNTDIKSSRESVSNRGRSNGRPDRGRNVDRGKRGHNSHLIQTQGLFSEGAGAVNTKRQMTRSYGSREASATETLQKPTISKTSIKVDPEVEIKHIRDILGDDDDEMEDDKSSESSDKVMPISLENKKIKTEDVKGLAHKLEALETKSEASFSDFLQQQSTQSQLLLLQLPDTLPATISKDLSVGDDDKIEGMETEANINGHQSNNFCTMHDLPEGQIGKLVRYKSGKMKLILGNEHWYDVTHGIDGTYLQEIVSIATNREERSGNIFNLGKVKGKLTVTPDWPKLFQDKS